MIKAVDLRKGRTVVYEDSLCVVHDASHVAKGNKRSYMQVKLKGLKLRLCRPVASFAASARIGNGLFGVGSGRWSIIMVSGPASPC